MEDYEIWSTACDSDIFEAEKNLNEYNINAQKIISSEAERRRSLLIERGNLTKNEQDTNVDVSDKPNQATEKDSTAETATPVSRGSSTLKLSGGFAVLMLLILIIGKVDQVPILMFIIATVYLLIWSFVHLIALLKFLSHLLEYTNTKLNSYFLDGSNMLFASVILSFILGFSFGFSQNTEFLFLCALPATQGICGILMMIISFMRSSMISSK